jgi:hypothetical protein
MTTREAPIPRGLVDDALPLLRALLGIVFVAVSAISTILLGSADLKYFIDNTTTIGYFPDRFWYASLFALILFLGEVATAERSRVVYAVFLIPDVFYTVRGMWAGMARGFTVMVGGAQPSDTDRFTGSAIGLIVSVVVGYTIAKYGEILLFGRRRKTTRRKDD